MKLKPITKHESRKIEKLLKEIAESLPASFTIYESFGFKELPNRQEMRVRTNFDIVPEYLQPKIANDRKKYIKVDKDRLWPVNHFRRIKKAYAENGEQGLRDYIDWVRKNNKLITDSAETKIAMELIENFNVIIL